RLGLGHHPPGQLGLEHRLHHAERHADQELVRAAARFEQQHARVRILGQPRGQHAPGRSGADNHLIEIALQRPSPHISLPLEGEGRVGVIDASADARHSPRSPTPTPPRRGGEIVCTPTPLGRGSRQPGMVCIAYNLYAPRARRQQAAERSGEPVMNAQTPIETRLEAFRERWSGKVGKMLIGGEWREAQSGETFSTEDPATGEKLADVASAGQADVDAAVAAARAAFEGPWSKVKPDERARLINKLADLIEAN